MNIGNITSNNFNLDNNGKDIQIEVYEQLIEQLQQENQELIKKYLNAVADYEQEKFNVEELKKQKEEWINILSMFKNQQKEFIEYLSNLSNWYSADGVKQGMVNEILSKYEEIIGGSNE